MKFNGFKTGGQFYPLSRKKGFVTTYDGPQSYCLFVAGCFGRVELIAVDEQLGYIPILDKEGQPVDGFDEYLIWLLSADERDLLTLFGVDTEAIGKGALESLPKRVRRG